MSIEQVKEFMEKSDQLISESVIKPKDSENSLLLYDLRIKLILEEVQELIVACQNNDIVEIADALADLSYVTDGAYLSFGLDKKALIDEVHRSNMTKFPLTYELAEDTVNFYAKKEIAAEIVDGGEYYIVKNSVTGKVLKSIEWEEPNLESIIYKK